MADQNDVVSTSMRRDHVASTLIRRHFNVVCPLGNTLRETFDHLQTIKNLCGILLRSIFKLLAASYEISADIVHSGLLCKACKQMPVTTTILSVMYSLNRMQLATQNDVSVCPATISVCL